VVGGNLGRVSARAGLLTAGRRLLDDCVDLPATSRMNPVMKSQVRSAMTPPIEP